MDCRAPLPPSGHDGLRFGRIRLRLGQGVDGHRRGQPRRHPLLHPQVVYHFGTKEKVFEQVVAEVFQAAIVDIRPRLDAAGSPRDKLRAYIAGRVGFLSSHRAHMLALFEIWMNLRTSDGQLRMSESDAESTVDAIEQLLRAGQASGDFGTFSPRVTAMAVRQAIDGVLLQLRGEPDLDLSEYSRELVELFDRATRRRR